MNVRDVIYYALIMCGKEDLAENVRAGTAPDDNPDVVRMLNCYNLTVLELSEEIEPLVFTENMTSEDGEYLFENFTKPPKQILKVEVCGKEVPFEVFYDRLKTDQTACEVTYDYRAARATSLADLIEYDEAVFSPRMLAMGVAGEYLLISGIYEESMTWRQRFERSVETYLLGRKTVIRPRRWI